MEDLDDDEYDEEDDASGYWKRYENIDMWRQGDVEIIEEWRSKYTIEELKRYAESKGYMAISFGISFSHAALKRFDY